MATVTIEMLRQKPLRVELCNIFYQFEGYVFENYEDLKDVTKNYHNSKHYDTIFTFKPWNDFANDFDTSLEKGNDIVTALDDAISYTHYPSSEDKEWTQIILARLGIQY